jgi:hypothetical protein
MHIMVSKLEQSVVPMVLDGHVIESRSQGSDRVKNEPISDWRSAVQCYEQEGVGTNPVPQGLRQADCETPGNWLVTHSARALALRGQWECAVQGEAPR